MRALVVLNPGSGSGDQAERVAPVWNAVASRPGWNVVQADDASAAEQAIRKAAAAGVDVVAAAGGDGTVHRVVQVLGALPEPPRLGVVPLGTGNDLARTLAVPVDAAAAIEVLDAGRERALDLCRVEAGDRTRYCINAATGGLSVAIADALSKEEKATWGPFAYVLGAARELGELEPFAVRLELDGAPPREVEALSVILANGRYAAGGMGVAPAADPEDGLLDLVTMRAGSGMAVAGLGPRLAAGRLLESELVSHDLVRRVVVDARPSMAFSLDGEPFEDERGGEAHGRIRFAVLPRRLRVLVGPDYHRDA
ncbi:MAG: diacylglycerol/lipid kinase family protein [Myxococcota bacterium]